MLMIDYSHLNNFFHEIKLANSGKKYPIIQIDINNTEVKVELEKESGNEWNQEYELIYLSYVLEK
jgi:hypothetical protein